MKDHRDEETQGRLEAILIFTDTLPSCSWFDLYSKAQHYVKGGSEASLMKFQWHVKIGDLLGHESV